MSGVEDLDTLISSMRPIRRPGRYVFVGAEPGALDVGDVHAMVVEDEGTSYVTTQSAADSAGLPYDYVAAWITLQVHSALSAVGLTAAFSTALADSGLSCNVLAGLHHDHLLVPYDDADRALEVLRGLAESPTR